MRSPTVWGGWQAEQRVKVLMIGGFALYGIAISLSRMRALEAWAEGLSSHVGLLLAQLKEWLVAFSIFLLGGD